MFRSQTPCRWANRSPIKPARESNPESSDVLLASVVKFTVYKLILLSLLLCVNIFADLFHQNLPVAQHSTVLPRSDGASLYLFGGTFISVQYCNNCQSIPVLDTVQYCTLLHLGGNVAGNKLTKSSGRSSIDWFDSTARKKTEPPVVLLCFGYLLSIGTVPEFCFRENLKTHSHSHSTACIFDCKMNWR